MKSLCKGICESLKPLLTDVTISRYDQGQKYCTTCCEYVVCSEIRCVCCKNILRVKSLSRRNEIRMKIQ